MRLALALAAALAIILAAAALAPRPPLPYRYRMRRAWRRRRPRMTMLTRRDCLSVALFLDERETELTIDAAVTGRPAASLAEIRRLRRIFDTLSGRGLDFTVDGDAHACHDHGTAQSET